MRINMPVTNVEVPLKESSMIVSKTDLKGELTYINRDFLEISGFTEQELIGASHNIVRHPDMPPEAFEDLWATLKAGRPWIGLVKNRCKNGDYYWVEAHAAPLIENGQVVGYVSVRKKPTRHQVEQAEQIYRLFREKKAGNLKVEFGGVVKHTLLRKLNIFRGMSIKARIISSCSLLLLGGLLIASASYLALTGLRDAVSAHDQKSIGRERLATKGSILVGNSVHYFKNSLLRGGDYPEKFAKEMDAIDQTVSEYRRLGEPSEAEERLLTDVSNGTKAYREAIAQVLKLRASNTAVTEIDKAVSGADKPIAEAFIRLATANTERTNQGLRVFEQRITEGINHSLIISAAVFGLMMLVGVICMALLVRAIRGPLDTVVRIMADVAQGNFNNRIEVANNDEAGRVLQGLEIMQTKLGFDVAEVNRMADENLRIKIALDNVSTGVMIADPGRTIIYANKSVQQILKGAEADIRKQLPSFSADKMMGVNIDSFHKNPAHQAQLLATFTSTYVANLEIGGRYLRVTASPVINARGERLGAVAEWLDRTAEVTVEQEVARIVDGAKNGDFAQRLSLAGKEGFFHQLAEGLNQLSEVTSNGLDDVARVLKSVAQGDLTQQIQGDYSGIFGQLKDDTNSTVTRLQEVLSQIRDASEAINTAAQQIAAGNQDLSTRTEEQASSLEETSSSMEELNTTVKQNADNAKQANELAKTSNAVATKGGEMVKRVVSTMSDIQDSSKKIADIIGVIDSIAFQTNILALNAAVEAARAGEQGRGFAVVATEVRNLAQRSATAAKEIKTLIAESVDKVEGGAKLVKEAGDTMDDVVASFQQVANLVTDIANASREQSSGIEQVTKAVGQMDEVTQQNAALVEEAAAAAKSLEDQASGLVKAVGMFKLSEGGAAGGYAAQLRPMPRIAAPAGASRTQAKRVSLPAATGEEEWEEF